MSSRNGCKITTFLLMKKLFWINVLEIIDKIYRQKKEEFLIVLDTLVAFHWFRKHVNKARL